MMAWLIGIVGVVFLTVLVDIICPEGKTNAFIKSMFSVFALYIIVSPVISVFNKEYKFTYKEIDLQESFLESVGSNNIDMLENKLQQKIHDNGYPCFVEIKGNVWGKTVNIDKITILLVNSVLLDEDKHINNCKVITQLVKERLEVDEEDIIYERL